MTTPESARPGPGERAEQDEQRAVREAWHDVACVEGPDCRDRSLHAMGQPLATSGVLAKFLNRLAELRPPSASPAATEAETGERALLRAVDLELSSLNISQYNAGDIEIGIYRAFEARDMEAVVGLLHMLAAKDPRRAQRVLDLINLGIEINRNARSTDSEATR